MKLLRFTIRHVLMAMVLVGIVLAIGRYVIWMNDQARRVSQRNDFRQILLALHSYDDQRRSFIMPATLDPATGQPLSSWRVALLPFLEASPYPDPNVPWDHPANVEWTNLSLRFYCLHKKTRPTFQTNIVAVTGEGTAWGDGTSKPASIKDLDGDTILIVETRNSGVHWMQPGDFDLATMPQTINAPDGRGLSGEFGDDVYLGCADGTVRIIKNGVPFSAIAPFFTIEGAKQGDLDEVLAEYQ